MTRANVVRISRFSSQSFKDVLGGMLEGMKFWNKQDPFEQAQSFVGDALLALGAAKGISAGATKLKLARAAEGRVAIGKMADLNRPGALMRGERQLDLPDMGSPKANWIQNSSKLREAMRSGQPIRDVSVSKWTGKPIRNTGFLRAERNLLANRGWKFNRRTGLWTRPK